MKKRLLFLLAAMVAVSLLSGCDVNAIRPRIPKTEVSGEEGGGETPQGQAAPSPSAAASAGTSAPPPASVGPSPGESADGPLLTDETDSGAPGSATQISGDVQPNATPTPVPTSTPTPTPTPAPAPVIPLAQRTLQFVVNGSRLELPLAEDGAFFDTVTLNAEYPAVFRLVVDDGLTVRVDGRAVTPGAKTEVPVPRIAHNASIPVTVSDGADTRTVFIRTLNSKIPTLSAAGQSPNEGDYYLSFPATPLILKLDENGDVLYYRCEDPPAPAGEDAALAGDGADDADPAADTPPQGAGLWDFQKHTLEDGRVRYSYLQQNPLYAQVKAPGYAAGARIILDERYNPIDSVSLRHENGTDSPADGHNFIMLDDGHYIAAGCALMLVDNVPAALSPNPQGSKVAAAHIQEIRDGRVTLDWYSTDYPDLYALSRAGYNDYANADTQQPDYLHLNSIAIDPADENLVCSFRNASAIIKINRRSGEIVWTLSGDGDQFGLTDAQKTSGQNDVRFTEDGFLTIFDNGVFGEETRVLKLKLDERNKRVEEYRAFRVPGRYSPYYGSAVNLIGDTFAIGWGYFAGGAASLTEIDFVTDKKLFELTLPRGVYACRCVKYA